MFDIGWTEMLVVAVVAILFVGPKELPGMLRTFGRTIKKVRMLAGDFQRQFDSALKDAELDGVKDGINQVRNLDPTKQIKDKLNPLKGELDGVKKSVEEAAAADYDPECLFDESKAPQMDEPVKIDVDGALEKQRQADKTKAKLPPSSGKNAVLGFGGPSGEASEPAKAKTAAKPKAKATTKPKAAAKPASKSTAAKSTTKTVAKPAATKKPATKKPAAKSTAKFDTKSAAAKKPAAAAKKPVAKSPPPTPPPSPKNPRLSASQLRRPAHERE